MERQNFQVTRMSPVSTRSHFDTRENARQEPPSVAEIQGWITSYLAEILEVDTDEIDTRITFDRYGLLVIGMTGDLENWLGCELDPTLVYDFTTIEALAGHLVNALRKCGSDKRTTFSKLT